MSTDNHTLIDENAPVNASTFNKPMGEIDAAIGDLSSLITVEKGSLVGAINSLLQVIPDRNRHLTLDGTDEPVLVGDRYLQVDSLTANTDITLPAISEFGIGRILVIMVTTAIASSSYYMWLKPYTGDAINGAGIIASSTAGYYIYKTVASYPGETGACWVSRAVGATIA